MPTPIVSFDGVVKRFGHAVAVERMNLDIYAGEFLAIMGSSGCGKTTTLRMLAGLETPTEGEIRLDGKRINDLPPSKRDTPMVWQSLALFPFLNVIKNVEFGLKMRGLDASARCVKATEWLEKLGIEEFAERDISQLSGGQRQRVALARALVTEPKILLLDEPLSALDANLVVRMQAVLSKLQKDLGITFIYVTHNQSEAFAMADRVVIMSQGKIEQIGKPRQVYRQPASRFVAEFVGTNNIIGGVLSKESNNSLTITTPIGNVVANISPKHSPRNPQAQTFSIGQPVDVIVSADLITLSGSPASTANSFECYLISEEFVGSIVTLLVETADGQELRVQKQQRELDDLMLDPERSLWASWDARSSYVISAKI